VASSYATAPSRRDDKPRRRSTLDDDRFSTYDTPRRSETYTEASTRGERSSRGERQSTTRSAATPSRSERAIESSQSTRPDPDDPHAVNQFPGQVPADYSAPYRPPSAANEGGPGLASDYYGDQGQSVYEQPGIRPEVLINSQPHLMPALAEAKPPEESGHGAADDFFNSTNTFDEPITPTASSQSKPLRPGPTPIAHIQGSGPGGISTPAALAGAASAAALGYSLSHQNSSHSQQQYSSQSQQYSSQTITSSQVYGSNGQGRLPSATISSRPPQEHSNSHIGAYALGAAGLAAGAYALEHQHSHQNSSQLVPHGHVSAPTPTSSALAMRSHQERRGPLGTLVDWWKDYEDVRKMEMYTEAIGVCADCFDPNTTIWDAPRKHHYHSRKRRSVESLRRSNEYKRTGNRIDKEYRYGGARTSDDERKRSSKTSLVAAGVAGYGLVKGAEALSRRRDEDETRSTRSRSERHRRSSSWDRRSSTSRGVIRDEDRYEVVSQETGKDGSYRIERRRTKRRSNSRSSSGSDHKMTSALIGAAAGTTAAAALGRNGKERRRKHSSSPDREYPGHHSRRSSGEESVERMEVRRHHSNGSRTSLERRSSRSALKTGIGAGIGGVILGGLLGSSSRKRSDSRSKKKSGLFSWSNASSSSAEYGLAYGADVRRDHRKSKERRSKSKSKKSDEEGLHHTLQNLAITGAALSAAQAGRSSRHSLNRHSSRPELIAARHRRDHHQTHESIEGQEEGWEDLPDDETEKSYDSDLVFGDFDYKGKGRKSTDSLVSNGSGTGTWNWWRWGRREKKSRRPSQEIVTSQSSSSFVTPAVAGIAAVAGVAGVAAAEATLKSRHDKASSVTSSAPSIQSVYPIATSDPYSFEAGHRTESQPLWTSRPETLPPIQAPQPMVPVSEALYAQPSPSYTTPAGPPVDFVAKPPRRMETWDVDVSERDRRRTDRKFERRSSSPILDSHVGTAIAGAAAAGAAAAVVTAAAKRSRRQSSPANVRFDLEHEKEPGRDLEMEARLRRQERERREQELPEERVRKERVEAEERARQDRIEAEARVAARERDEAIRRDRARREAEDQARAEHERLEDLERERARRERERQEAREAREAERRAILREEERRAEEEREKHASALKTAAEIAIGGAAAAVAVGAIASSSSKGKEREKEVREAREVRPEEPPVPVIESKPAVIHEPVVKEHEIAQYFSSEVAPDFAEHAPSGVDVDTFDDDFDPNYFKRKNEQRRVARKAASLINSTQEETAEDVYNDLEQRYERKEVDAGQFFAPEELRDDTRPVSPSIPVNADVDIPVYNAEQDPRSAFRDVMPDKPYTENKGYMAPWTVPTLKLIEPTPPPSRAGSPLPPQLDEKREEVPKEPVKEVTPEPKETRAKDREVEREDSSFSGRKAAEVAAGVVAGTAAAAAVGKVIENRKADREEEREHRGEETPKQRPRSESRVRFGDHETFHYEVLTPEPVTRDSYMGTKDAHKEPQGHDEIVVETEDSRTSYKPEQPVYEEHAPDPQFPVRDDRQSRRTERDVDEHVVEPRHEVISPDETPVPPLYQAPFYETVSDLGSALGGHNFVVPAEPGHVEELPDESPTVERKMPGAFDSEEDEEVDRRERKPEKIIGTYLMQN
jgi:hypothetical protein